jgi:beta-phosphoglucomutase-like phosphatase (HAD superfamily)
MRIWNFYDFDDTLVLTRIAIYRSYRDAFRKVMNIELLWDEFNDKLYSNSNSYMAQLGFTNKNISDVKKEKNKVYIGKHWKDINILKDEFNVDEKHIIVSNTSSDVINSLLKKLKMNNIFADVIGSDIYLGVNRKPAPDLYNYAFSTILGNFNYDTDWIVIHEDSIYGLHAALSFYEDNKSKIKNFKINYIPQNFN